MKVAIARQKTSKKWRTVEMSWEQFLGKIRDPHRTAETVREYEAMSKADRDAAKEVAGGFVGGALSSGQRKTENVTERSLITLDADHAKARAWQRVTVLHDFRMACYSTHSHTEAHPRIRWVIPVDRPMTPDEYPAVARRVAEWLDIETMDPTTYEVARLMYWPTCAKDGVYEYHEQDGPVLKVDEVLMTYGYGEAWKDTSLWPIAKAEQEIRVREQKKAGDPTEKQGMIGLFCRTYTVYDVIEQFLSDIYTETANPDRYTFVGGSTAGGAVIYDDGKFLYSNHATDPVNGEGSVNAFDLVRIHLFGEQDADATSDTPITKLPSYKAMSQWAAELPDVKSQMVEERAAAMESEFGDLLGAADEAEEKDDNAWKHQLELNNKTGECEPTVNNALLILLNDPLLKGKFGYDVFAAKPKLRGDVPWRPVGEVVTAGRGTEWIDVDEAGLRWYLQHKWKFRSENDLRNALELAMRANAFHPVREYLNGLLWDGKQRVGDVFIRHMGAADTNINRTMTRKWFAAAVARVMRPGCKFDACLVLMGDQGAGKSSFADVLSKGWFNDSEVNMQSKDGYASLHGNWIIELAELASVKRAEVESVKTFISKREDTYRPAYMKHTATFKRQNVFFATTNELEFLRDRTGNRRWWVIDVDRRVNRDDLEAEVDQLWAEAVQIYKSGEKLWLDEEEEAELNEVQDIHKVQDELEGQVDAYLDTLLPENWYDLTPEARRDFIHGDSLIDPSVCTMQRKAVSLTEIRIELLGEDRRRSGGGNDLTSRRLANIMNYHRGWQKSKKRERVPIYGPQWVYHRRKTTGDQT